MPTEGARELAEKIHARTCICEHVPNCESHASCQQSVAEDAAEISAFAASEVARAWEEAAQIADKEQQHYCEMAKSDEIESEDEAEFYAGKAEACGNVAAALREAARKEK